MRISRSLRALAAAAALVALVLPAVGKAAPGIRAVKISTRAPSWYTQAFQDRVMAAGDRGVHIPNGVTIPASSIAFLGIRPGQLIVVQNGPGLGVFSLCTSNFVFKDGDNFAIGTAGHCGDVGNPVSMLFLPKVFVNIGTITKSTGDAGVGNDFALISIRPELNRFVSPSMAFWGGPKSAYDSFATPPTIVKYVGWGLGIGTGGTPRIGVGTSYSWWGEWRFEGVSTPGDSGGGAISGSGAAVGNITHIVVNGGRKPFVWFAGTSIQRILQIAGMPLATCASGIPWPLPGCP